jgi:hypothetical protein
MTTLHIIYLAGCYIAFIGYYISMLYKCSKNSYMEADIDDVVTAVLFSLIWPLSLPIAIGYLCLLKFKG